MRQHLGEPHAGLAVGFERLDGRQDRVDLLPGRHGGEAALARTLSGICCPFFALQARLVVEQIDMRGRAALPQHHHALGFRLEVRQARQRRHAAERARAARPVPPAAAGCQRGDADARGGAPEELAAGKMRARFQIPGS